MVHNIEKATAQVFLDCLKLEVSSKVLERTINTHAKTIEMMSSMLFGMVKFGGDVGLTGFNARFIDTAIANLTGGHSVKDMSRRAIITDGAICRFVIDKFLAQVFAGHEHEEAAIRVQDTN